MRQRKLDALERQHEEAQNEVLQLRDSLDQQKSEADSRIMILEDGINQEKLLSEKLKGKLDTLKEQDTKSKGVNKEETNIQELQFHNTIHEKDRKIEELSQQVTKLESRVTSKIRDLLNTRIRIAALLNANTKLTEDISKFRKDYEEKIEYLEIRLMNQDQEQVPLNSVQDSLTRRNEIWGRQMKRT